MRKAYFLSLLLCCITTLYTHTFAQSTDASVTGIVRSMDDGELPGATVMIRNESTGFETGTVTNVNGKYNVQQLPLGGPYTISASFVGFGEIQKKGFHINQGDQLVIDFSLSQASTELEEIVISDQDLRSRIQREGNALAINAERIENLPIEGRNFTGLTSLSPLQGGGSINLGGQRRTSTNVTLDGVNARNQLTAGEIGRGPYTVSIEAIREFEVATNVYDVTQGRQAGGSLNAVTKSGTNKLEGSAFVYHRNDALSSQVDIRGNERDQDFYNYQWGFSLGGPIVKDKVHYFVTFDRQDAGEPVFIADINNENDESRLGIRQDTLQKFINIARQKYGVADEQQVGEFSRKTIANTIFARIDWQLNNKHKLTLRNNYTNWENPLSIFDNADIELAESVGSFESNENSLLLSLRSNLKPTLTNELKLQYQRAERAFGPNPQLPFSNIPRAIVNVTSPFPTEDNPDATRTREVQIGGQRYSPETNLEHQFQLVNTTYLQAGKFNFTFGTDNMITYLETLLSNEQNGRFFFSSLEDFDNLNPFRYAREVPLQGLPIVKQTVLDMSLFGQVEYDITPNLNAMFGLRYDVTAFLDDAAYNPTLDNELGIRTDNKIVDWNNIQPRFQATWDVQGSGNNFIKLGGGIFSAQPHYYAQVNNIQNSGVLLGAVDVSGDQVPEPDFVGYRENPDTAPGIPEGADVISTINAVSDDFEVPSTFKANLSYTHLFSDRFSMTINGLISHTWNNYVYQERNLVDEPYFRIEEEANRGVYVPAYTIDERGRNNWLDSRKSTNLGRVLELNSDGKMEQMALVLELNYRIGKDGSLQTSYTWNRAKDNSSYNCCVANTSTFLPVKDDPRALNWGFADSHFDNKLVVNFLSPSFYGFSLGATVVGTGGTRYSFLVSGSGSSLNGDFNLRNDLAYVYDPNDPATPENIREGILSILNDEQISESTKDYLKDNFGRIADRNAGVNPFFATMDLRLIKKVTLVDNHSLEFTADMFNFTNFLNEKWGANNELGSSQNLLQIQGFDQTTQTYQYDVQSGVGTKPINGTPWRLQLGVRYSF
ncbi:carboxypeptidase regulatory-like domain-containing protein [Porifericola rhodea]|uniref:TonB-dependent receptor n=1 Tax=Porifericola rhodea TaxID=930972 RepID=UPI002665CB03|nr:carboxypeptidase regulatory-like domain-containing protein [Porifericola rhodea]WKN32237.1 carboxypeptidase regulatory-like domain-containing protein [Porifericola rhodea]